MINYNSFSLRIIFAVAIYFIFTHVYATDDITINPEQALAIGLKIWYNESGGSVLGLTTWNNNENFASLGIGHFIWHPNRTDTSFPLLLKYMQAKGIAIPSWLQNDKEPCPWKTRQQFMEDFNSPQMIELREFLLATIPMQTEFILLRAQKALPRILEGIPSEERPYIIAKFYNLAKTSQGLYALVDYINFKGEGLAEDGRPANSSGLFQVLNGMRYAPCDMTDIQAFVWSANRLLTLRVLQTAYRQNGRWLDGWRNRLKTYIE